MQTQINIQTPTQRFHSPDEHLMYQINPKSITEFIPLNLNIDRDENDIDDHDTTTNDDDTVTTTPFDNDNDIAFSQTADSALAESMSNNLKPLIPANKTGNIVIINKKKNKNVMKKHKKLKQKFTFF
eukprot:196771_1